MHVGEVELLGGEVGADRLRVVDREDRVDVVVGGQQADHDLQAAFAGAFAVLVVGHDLDAGRLGERLLAAVDAVDHRGHRRAVHDRHLALAVQLLGDVLAGLLAGFDVVGGDRGGGTLGGDVHRDGDDAGRLQADHGRLDRDRIGRVDQHQIDAGRDEVVDLGGLLVQVIVGGYRRDGDVPAGDLLGPRFGALDDLDEEGVAEAADGDADRLQFGGRGRGRGEGGQGKGGRCGEQGWIS